MAELCQDTAQQLLEGVVEERLLEAYLNLVAADGCPGADAEKVCGGSEVVGELTARGMAYLSPADPADPCRLIPAQPFLVLQGALAALSARLQADHERLMAGHRRLDTYRHDLPSSNEGKHPTVEVVTDRAEVTRLSYSLISTARRDWVTLENSHLEVPLEEITASPPLPRFKGTVRCRTIYDTAFVEHPVAASVIEASVQAGEEARILPSIPMKMKLADEAVALLPLTPTGMSGALVVRSAVIIAALRNYFELLWERAVPINDPNPQTAAGPPLGKTGQQVLHLLAQGLTDEAIANRIGKSPETVRRHSSTIRELLGVESRFAAGAAAVRRGWIK